MSVVPYAVIPSANESVCFTVSATPSISAF
jgi:hypothetical protein